MSPPRSIPLVVGSLPSPFVRKVLAVLELKGLPYEIDPIIPFFGDDRFTEISPLRRIPVYIDDKVTLSDSSVICQYLEDRYLEPRAYPADIAQRAQARWYEEYADSHMTDVCIWRIFYPTVVKPHVFKAERDTAAIETAVREDLPGVLSYLEGIAPQQDFLFGDISIADISLAVHLRNLKWARFEVTSDQAPKAMAWLARVQAHPCLVRITEAADICIRTAPAGQRDVMRDNGLKVAAESLGGDRPRRGPMTL